MAGAMRTIKDVEILHAGIEYLLSTGPTTFTPEDLRDAVMAANEDPSIPNPRLKIGHIDPRFNGPEFDGEPAFGKATNLRLSENGMTVLADYIGVPGWLADILPTAYPSRSIEGYWNVKSQHGKDWRFVLSACSLLGVTWPGVTVLEDLPQWYGDEMPEGVVIDEELVAAAQKQSGGDPVAVTASANLDDVRRAFYNDYLPGNLEAIWWWVQAILTDPNELVVEDDETGQLYKIPFSSDDAGAVSFGDAVAVRIDYIPDERMKEAASFVAASLAVGRTVLASWPTRAASRPDNPGGAMDPKEVRKALNLPEDASDEQVQEALLLKAGLTTAEGVAVEPPAAPVAPVVVPPVAQEPEESAAPAVLPIAAAAGLSLPPGTVLIDEATWAQTQAGLSQVNELVANDRKTKRDALVAAAIGDGRIPPARKDHWDTYLKTDPEGGAAALASLKPNIIPLEERGHGNTPEAAASVELEAETVHEWSRELFHEVRNTDERAAAAGGLGRRQRIVSDGKYTR